MNSKEAKELYQENWDLPFTTMEELYKRIKTLAENGAYSLCVYVDSKKLYNEVFGNLCENGYDTEHYNGGNNGIIEVKW